MGKACESHWQSSENPAQEKCYTQARGFSPIHARVSPVGVRVCALACVRSRVRAWAYVCARVWACACASYPARAHVCVCYACAIPAIAGGYVGGAAVLYACLFFLLAC